MDSTSFFNPDRAAAALSEMGIPTTKRQAYRIFNEPGFPLIRIRGKVYCRRESLVNWLKAQEPAAGETVH